MTYRKKLIEVALPLEAINMESAREKSIRHGHPSTLHLWWARRPLAACRAVLWSSLVDDRSSWPDRFPTEDAQKKERQRLFDILGRITIETDRRGTQKQVVRGLVSWDDINNPKSGVLESAQREIARCLAWDRKEEPPIKPDAVQEYIAKYAPPAYDPFAGGGSIPLEAQRLGLEAHASDLNPVPVLINKALIEIPPKFKDHPPVNPEDSKQIRNWRGVEGLAADVRYYGQWMWDEAFKRIGHLYPKVQVVQCKDGIYRHATNAEIEVQKSRIEELTVIAWIWARTVKCPNPACVHFIPTVSSFILSSKKGQEAYLSPIVNPDSIEFEISSFPPAGYKDPQKGLKRGVSGVFICPACETITTRNYIASEAKDGRLGEKQVAMVALRKNGRAFLPSKPINIDYSENIFQIRSSDLEIEFSSNPRDVWCKNFGLETPKSLFTPRQLCSLTLFADLVSEAASLIKDDCELESSYSRNKEDYANAIATYLGLAVSKSADLASTICHWQPNSQHLKIAPTFSRHVIPMAWDFAEGNPFSESSGNFYRQFELIEKVLVNLQPCSKAFAEQKNATNEFFSKNLLISTDPPYYDNIAYADLADFFYVWLRRSVGFIYPKIFSTMMTPKSDELVALSYRFSGSQAKASQYFDDNLGKFFENVFSASSPEYPVTIYYAFKQAEQSLGDGVLNVSSTGWETMLEALLRTNFKILGTWPVRTEKTVRSISIGTNALASSIVLVCRPRPTDALKITRRQFLTELKRGLPKALKTLQQGNVAPVDLAQASIGPGMAIFSQYVAVLENDGSPMRVRTALQLINQILDEFLTEQEGEFDGDTRWALTWFEQYQFGPGQYGDAETLSKAKNTSVQGMVDAGILEAKAGKVRLLKRDELKSDWNPTSDSRMPDWEIAQYLIHELDQKGELGAADLLAKLGDRAEAARDLAYRLYSLCDKKGWTQEAIAYNSLVISWPEITRLASEVKPAVPMQQDFGF